MSEAGAQGAALEDAADRGELGALGSEDAKLNPAAIRTIVLALTAVVTLLPFQGLIVKFIPKIYAGIPIAFHSFICWSFGVRRHVVGVRSDAPGVLYVANHISWLDIPVLGSVLRGSFVAKAEIETWGFFGILAKLQRTIFVVRERRTSSAEQRNQIVDHLAQGHNVILFPEGTSSAGNGVLPFKSALFSVVEAAQNAGLQPVIQPVSLAYTNVNSIPLVRANRHMVSWVGDMEFLPHLIQVMRLSAIDATIHFHEPVQLDEFDSRKALAQHCEDVVGQGVRLANSGRLEDSHLVANHD
ncbi:MAG: lysophospholipid acyltransferase family protein [Pseudomonadota bacterium]